MVLGIGRVRSGKTTAIRPSGADQVAERGTGHRAPQRVPDRSRLVGEGRRLPGLDHHRVVGHVDIEPAGAVGQGQPHADSPGAWADRARSITAVATRSVSRRQPGVALHGRRVGVRPVLDRVELPEFEAGPHRRRGQQGGTGRGGLARATARGRGGR